MAAIQVVLVLYKCSFEQSESLTSLLGILQQHPEWAGDFDLLVYDNSPQSQTPAQTPIPLTYLHNPANQGLAVAYNAALTRAEQQQCAWILLLDQDTRLTPEFVEELLRVAGSSLAEPRIGAIVPKLMVEGVLHSPAVDFLTQLRKLRNPPPSAYSNVVGLREEHLVSYNSGSAVRVAALRAVGGFPEEFWLDFLDHAVFHRLFGQGYRVYILESRLTHDFSESSVRTVPTWRQLNALRARTLYIQQTGTLIDRLIYRVWLLRHARSLRRAGANAEVWKGTALAAIAWKSKDNF